MLAGSPVAYRPTILLFKHTRPSPAGPSGTSKLAPDCWRYSELLVWPSYNRHVGGDVVFRLLQNIWSRSLGGTLKLVLNKRQLARAFRTGGDH